MNSHLAPYAATPAASYGRNHAEAPPSFRSEYQRDRDRVIHSAAFRRLEYKTQVFVNHEGDMFRTRLTHSIEVAQIARTVARALKLNEDLTEAIALAHDLGHTPFGHAGQRALDRCMKAYGGFEHNLQSLRIVDHLEEKYAAFPGLNLTYETREGILKHCTRRHAAELGEVGSRFLNGTQPGLEAQLSNLADEIAYNNHDVDDGLRAGLIGVDELRKVALFASSMDQVLSNWPGLIGRRLIYETVRHMIGLQVTSLIETSQAMLEANRPESINAVRRMEQPLITFDEAMRARMRELKRFLTGNLYQHPRVTAMTMRAERTVSALFDAYLNDPATRPSKLCDTLAPTPNAPDNPAGIRPIADYIAGMTDRYAIAEYGRIFGSAEPT